MNPDSKLAQYLLEIKAVKLQPKQPFKWSSGWHSPIYCDNRITLSYPHIRDFIKVELAQLIKTHFEDADALCGVATAGIAIGALVADEMNLPFAYCRPKPKEHGLQNQLEGHLNKDARVVVVEDLISTGGSSLKVVEFLRNEGYNVVGMVAIFSYGFQVADENFKIANCSYATLGNFEETIKHASATGYVQEEDLQALKNWRINPASWS